MRKFYPTLSVNIYHCSVNNSRFSWLRLNSSVLDPSCSVLAQPHTTLCIQFLNRENNDKNNALPLGKQVCFTIVWGRVEILPHALSYNVKNKDFVDNCI